MLRRLSTRQRILLLVAASALPLITVSLLPGALGCAEPGSSHGYTLGTIAGSVAAVAMLAWHSAQRLVLDPIRRILEMAQRVRGGDLAARTGFEATHEELSQLGAAFDAMAERLQVRERELRQALERLTHEAITDPLTGLYNRRFLYDALAREAEAAKRKQIPFSVILLDIDRFKHVNDTWGHDAGDIVLREIASLLEQSVRGSDIAVRHGGEEFAILLPETPLDTAVERAESLRRELAGKDIACDGGRVRVTASFGVAEYGSCTADPDSLMKAADAAMYAAKSAGRDRVVASALSGPPRRGAVAAADASALTSPE